LIIVPSAPPQDVDITVINSTAVLVSWGQPVVSDQNGVITFYAVMVVDLLEDNITNVTVSDDTKVTVNGTSS